MAKDPAILFYTSDFLTGTMFFSDEQTGKYIRLLCAQHQKGRLSEKDMINICKTYDKDIFSKFIKDDEGNYFNERLEKEAIKRKKYSESRSKNRLSVKGEETTYVKHMENENENINNSSIQLTINHEKEMLVKTASPYAKKIIPTLDEVIEYLVLEKNESQNEAEKFFDYYQANGWRVGKNPMKDWKAAARNWLKNASNYNKQTLKTNKNGKQLSKQELEQQEFNRRYGTTFGQQTF
ncbi:MAG: hypothetical protein EBV32_03900 [Proteobacteria bacterium]|uniref:DUF1376 domain-containing protein n=1 Tax=Candidatus Fonsibacter lacus TaxID=2576439 RepID=A0A964XS08_9PROT|nr:hypothetical protein [Candidatus Fonsibacter lacus]NBP60148.1 hypothetical protein [Pseudomonadota bacterium]NCU72262.1 hypothetical protein [Candidatus Fonsibacter lacus]